MIENLLYAKVPPRLKRSINRAYLENGTFEQTVRHLEREMELNELESKDTGVETQMTVMKKQPEDKPTRQKNSKKETTYTKNSALQHIAKRPMSLL